MSRAILTYSSMQSFLDCPRKYLNREIKCLTSKEKNRTLDFGSAWHGALERWYTPGDQDVKCAAIKQYFSDCFPNRESDYNERRDFLMLDVMFSTYLNRFPEEDFDVIAAETKFLLPIINPNTGRISRTFNLSGKVDGLIRMKETGELYILEHKTASSVDGSYLEKLPLDFQINLYAYALSRHLKRPITGVIYNVIQKSGIKLKMGETEEAYQKKLADRIAESKTGKSALKRIMPQTDEEFTIELRSKYRDPEMITREQLLISPQDLKDTEQYVWTITQKIIGEMNEGDWLPNRGHCFKYGKTPCQYWALCRSKNSELVQQNFYDIKPPHEELAEVTEPLF
ncbi:MAG: PD-(D/E)XK nuclease family protein [bacterium]|nr:PD-(D/E)XK nuclease family protein [bacterium]